MHTLSGHNSFFGAFHPAAALALLLSVPGTRWMSWPKVAPSLAASAAALAQRYFTLHLNVPADARRCQLHGVLGTERELGRA